MNKFTSLFQEWQDAIGEHKNTDSALKQIIEELHAVQRLLPVCVFIQDYRDMGIRFISENVHEISGYLPEHFYNRGIELGLQILHPDDRSEVLVFQKRAFDLLKTVPSKLKGTVTISHLARVKNRASDQYQYIKQTIKPILFDKEGHIILDIAIWQLAEPLTFEGEFLYSFSYYNEEGKQIKYSNKHEVDTSILSKSERTIFGYLIKGKSSKDIAAQLNLSKHTIDTHRRNILKKYQVSRTTELMQLFNNQIM